MSVHEAVNPPHGADPSRAARALSASRVVTETRVMSKLISALLLALSLATVACDEGDDKRVERDATGVIDDIADNGESTDGDTDGEATDTDGDEDDPGCVNALPPTGGPDGPIGGNC